MLLTRTPRPILRPFVKSLWAMDESTCPPAVVADRERVLPTGMMHLVFRLSDHPLRLFESDQDHIGHTLGHTIVGGARSAHYIRDISAQGASVGAQLLPGASEVLLGVPAGELAQRHTLLEDLWGRSAAEMRERLCETQSRERRLDLFESLLAARLPRIHGLHPAVAHALEQFASTSDVSETVRQTGYSHRRFIALFSRSVGLTPKLYCRILRFQNALELSAAHPTLSSVELALEAGYSDQAHFSRQFREFAGVTPGEYHQLSPSSPNHVPVRRG